MDFVNDLTGTSCFLLYWSHWSLWCFLQLGCSYGLPGIFACLKVCSINLNLQHVFLPEWSLEKEELVWSAVWYNPWIILILAYDHFQGASTVHFQDLNAETVRCTTIPNVLANLEQARDRQSRQPEIPLTPSRQALAPEVHFYAGDWQELHTVLSVLRRDGFETPGLRLSFSEDDFMDGCSSQDGSAIGHDPSSRRSRKLSGSRAWERANESDPGEGGYDVILMTEIHYSVTSLRKLYALIKKVCCSVLHPCSMRSFGGNGKMVYQAWILYWIGSFLLQNLRYSETRKPTDGASRLRFLVNFTTCCSVLTRFLVLFLIISACGHLMGCCTWLQRRIMSVSVVERDNWEVWWRRKAFSVYTWSQKWRIERFGSFFSSENNVEKKTLTGYILVT